MDQLKHGIRISFAFHAMLTAVLAWRVVAPAPLEIRAGEDSVLSLTMTMASVSAEQQALDTPVIVTKQEVRIADRRLVESPSTIEVPLDVPTVELARSLVGRLADSTPSEEPVTEQPTPPPPPKQVANPPTPKPSPAPQVASTAARSTNLGAQTAKPRKARVVPPVFIDPRPPVYPIEARRHGWSGTVELRITVDASGAVREVQVHRSSGYSTLDAAAVRAVQTWRGKPATRDGVPFESKWNKPIKFQ